MHVFCFCNWSYAHTPPPTRKSHLFLEEMLQLVCASGYDPQHRALAQVQMGACTSVSACI